MKHSLLFWSRKSHCWAGVYLSAVTLLCWRNGAPARCLRAAVRGCVPIPRRILRGNACGVRTGCAGSLQSRTGGRRTVDARYGDFFTEGGSWVVRDAGRYVSVTYDVRTGEARERAFDSVKLVEEKNGLAWLSPELGAGLKLSFQPLFILLCVTGIHLLLGRNRRPGKEKERAATLDAVRTGETCLYERAG